MVKAKTAIPLNICFTYFVPTSVRLISSIMTTNKKSTITAPTYTNISITDKNSALSNNHNIAEKKNEKTRLTADLTGLLQVITLVEVYNNKAEIIRNNINSIFIQLT